MAALAALFDNVFTETFLIQFLETLLTHVLELLSLLVFEHGTLGAVESTLSYVLVSCMSAASASYWSVICTCCSTDIAPRITHSFTHRRWRVVSVFSSAPMTALSSDRRSAHPSEKYGEMRRGIAHQLCRQRIRCRN